MSHAVLAHADDEGVRVRGKVVVLPLIRHIERVLNHDFRSQNRHIRLAALTAPASLAHAGAIDTRSMQSAVVGASLAREDSQLQSEHRINELNRFKQFNPYAIEASLVAKHSNPERILQRIRNHQLEGSVVGGVLVIVLELGRLLSELHVQVAIAISRSTIVGVDGLIHNNDNIVLSVAKNE